MRPTASSSGEKRACDDAWRLSDDWPGSGPDGGGRCAGIVISAECGLDVLKLGCPVERRS